MTRTAVVLFTRDLHVHDRPAPAAARRDCDRVVALFMKHLIDGDAASNRGNWQWVAGTGADPRPNRAFNPTRQGRMHDPDGDYVRRWLPELADLPAARIHDPASEQRRAFGYVDPICIEERVT